jgi:hypothetical protein
MSLLTLNTSVNEWVDAKQYLFASEPLAGSGCARVKVLCASTRLFPLVLPYNDPSSIRSINSVLQAPPNFAVCTTRGHPAASVSGLRSTSTL